MLKILDNFSERLINIIHLLFKSDGKLQIERMVHLLEVSEKTLYDDFDFINDNFGHVIDIKLSDNGEIWAPKMSMSTFLELQSIILLDTFSVKIIKSIFFYPNQKLSFHIDRLHLSSSTFYKYIHLISDFLNEFEIDIEKNQSLYLFTSPNELRLRRFFTTLFLHVTGYSSKIFLEDDTNDFLKKRIATLYHMNDTLISSNMISFYADYYYFSLKREEQGFHLTSPKTFSGLWQPLTEDERYFLSSHFKNVSLTNLQNTEMFILVHHHKFTTYTDEHLETTIPNFIKLVFETFQLDANKKEYDFSISFLKDLYISEYFMKVPFHLITNKYVYFTNEASKNNPWAVSELNHLITALSSDTGINFNYHIDYMIYNLIIHLPEIMENRLSQYVLIISDNSKAHAEFLCDRIQMELNMAPTSFQHVSCIYKEDLPTIDRHSYELVVTNSIVINETIDSILINSFPTVDDIDKIRQVLI